MARVVRTIQALLKWRRSLKAGDRVALCYVSSILHYGNLEATMDDLPWNYKVVVLFYSEPDQYAYIYNAEYFQQSKKISFKALSSSWHNIIIYAPSRQEMTRLCSNLKTVSISKTLSFYPKNDYIQINVMSYMLPFLAVSLLVKPYKIKSEWNSLGTNFLARNIMNYIGASFLLDIHNLRGFRHDIDFKSCWRTIHKHFTKEFEAKVKYYRYVRSGKTVPVAMLGGYYRYYKDAHLGWDSTPDSGPDALLFNGLQNTVTIVLRQSMNIVRSVCCFHKYLNLEQHLLNYVVNETIKLWLWRFPNIRFVSGKRMRENMSDAKVAAHIQDAYVVTFCISSLIVVHMFLRDSKFYGTRYGVMVRLYESRSKIAVFIDEKHYLG